MEAVEAERQFVILCHVCKKKKKHLSIFSCNVLVMYMCFTNLLLVSVRRKLTAYQFLHYLCQLRVASMS